MSRARFRRVWSTAVLFIAASPAACHHESSSESKRDPGAMDGMEQTAARRVGLESAADAMQRRDLQRLKMLSVWVRGRARVVLFEPDDLKALDVAITCLDGSLAPSERTQALGQIKTGKLLKPARELCLSAAE